MRFERIFDPNDVTPKNQIAITKLLASWLLEQNHRHPYSIITHQRKINHITNIKQKKKPPVTFVKNDSCLIAKLISFEFTSKRPRWAGKKPIVENLNPLEQDLRITNQTELKNNRLNTNWSQNSLINRSLRRTQVSKQGPVTAVILPQSNKETWTPSGTFIGTGIRNISQTLSRGAIVRKKASRETLRWRAAGGSFNTSHPVSKISSTPWQMIVSSNQQTYSKAESNYAGSGIFPVWKTATAVPVRSWMYLINWSVLGT